MRIGLVGSFVNHGFDSDTSAAIAFLLSTYEDVKFVDVYCPHENNVSRELDLPRKIRIFGSYAEDDPVGLIRTSLMMRKEAYDKVLLNLSPTGFGSSSLANLMGILMPVFMSRLMGKNRVFVIYHNSVYTNYPSKLGYDGLFNSFRLHILKVLEFIMFKTTRTGLLLRLYKKKIDEKIGTNLTTYIDTRYWTAMSAIFMNKLQDTVQFKSLKSSEIPVVLLHGSWGPQKNIEGTLLALEKARKVGLRFKLLISGRINHHFPEYKSQFISVLDRYSETISEFLGAVDEERVMKICSEADLLIIFYNAPGGRSGVLETAIFYECPTIVVDFPEFREQAGSFKFVRFCKASDLSDVIIDMLGEGKKPRSINIREKVSTARANVRSLIAIR
jgi:glycosyltransferase involved in cell wall biosynthesis